MHKKLLSYILVSFIFFIKNNIINIEIIVADQYHETLLIKYLFFKGVIISIKNNSGTG